jgi:drug/metabolite transporter (DMT)-like permease
VVSERKSDSASKLWCPSVLGVTLAVLAALGQALGMVLAKKVITDDTDAILANHIRMSLAVPAFAIMFLVLRWYPRVASGLKNRKAMAQLTLGTCVGPVLGVILLIESMKYLSAAVSQTFVALLPIVIIPFVMVIHKERVSPRAAIGAVIAVAGVAILFIK